MQTKTLRRFQYAAITLLIFMGAGAYYHMRTLAGVAEKRSPDLSLAGYWPFNEGSGTGAGDHSGNGNTGTLTNMEAGDWVDGKLNKGLDFDGSNEYVTVADNATLDFGDTADLSLSGWFYRDTFAADHAIIAKRNGIANTDDGYIAYIDDADDKLYFEVSENSGADEYQLASTTAFTAAGWYHFAIVWDQDSAANTEIYINGVDDNATDTGTIGNIGDLSNALALNIGAESDAGLPFDGKLDETRVHSRALSAAEITSLYALGVTKLNASQNTLNTNGLVGLWSMNGADVDWSGGNEIKDRSGNGNDGNVLGSMTIANAIVGKIAQGMDFDGTDDDIDVADNATLDFGDTADFTVSGWFNRDTFAADHTVIAKRNGIADTDDGYIAYIDDADDKLYFEVSENSGADEYQLASASAFTATGWYHFVIVWDENSAANTEIYINGIADNATDTGTIGNIGDLSNALTLDIGAESDAGLPFDGKLDEIRVHNRALSATEIESLYKLGSGTHANAADSQQDRFQRGLAGYWKIDEGTGTSTTADSSTNGNTLTMTNLEVGDWTTGQILSALDFDGVDEYLTVADPSSGVLDFADATDLTITGWFNRDTFAADHTIIAKKNDQTTNQGYIVWIDNNGATDTLIFEASDGTDTYQVPSVTQFNATGWHHYAVTWNDNVGVTLSIDGSPNTGTPTGTFSSVNSLANALAFRLGAESDAGLPFDGKLDEQRVYNRAFSADEIADLYRATQPKDADTSLKGYWTFNGSDISGTTAFDRSGGGNNGTLTGGPTLAIGKLGQGMNFDGVDDYVSTGADVGALPAKTYSAWVKPNTATGTWDPIAFEATAFNSDQYVGLISGASRTTLWQARTVGAAFFLEVSVPAEPPVGAWTHIVAIVDKANNELRMYVNGVLDGTLTDANIGSSTFLNPTGGIYIGGSLNQSNYYDAKLDDVRVYNRVLSTDEIKQLYLMGR